jgi:hypothetical protein
VSDQQIDTIGGVRRDLEDILTEVAEGTSRFIFLG